MLFEMWHFSYDLNDEWEPWQERYGKNGICSECSILRELKEGHCNGMADNHRESYLRIWRCEQRECLFN
jgi:hypothetical protein